jgi:hypothetical protein
MPEVSVKEHSKFRWLINLDGISASFRFGQLLHINSVVLKMKSRRIEYFYRAVENGTHYLDFWTKSKDDIFELVPKLNEQWVAVPALRLPASQRRPCPLAASRRSTLPGPSQPARACSSVPGPGRGGRGPPHPQCGRRRYSANASYFHEIAERAQKFASLYLSPRARFLYWRAAISSYHALAPDMAEYVAKMVGQLRAAGKLNEIGVGGRH